MSEFSEPEYVNAVPAAVVGPADAVPAMAVDPPSAVPAVVTTPTVEVRNPE